MDTTPTNPETEAVEVATPVVATETSADAQPEVKPEGDEAATA